jgi:hypothetical protein
VVPLGWLVLALCTITMFRVAAISDARRQAELSEWLAMSALVEHRASDQATQPASRSRTSLRRAAG